MTRLVRAGGLFVVLAALVACGGAEGGVPLGVNEGNRARNFTLETLDGTAASLEDYQGSVVLINFWATWCAPCRDEVPDLQAAYDTYQEERFVVLGVNVEEARNRIIPFVAELEITYPILLDETGQVLKLYRTLGLPTSILVDRDGVIQVRHIGYLSADQLERYLAKLLP